MMGKHSFKMSSIFKAVIDTLDLVYGQYLIHNAFCCVIRSTEISVYEALLQNTFHK